jgi:hypothetical protein
MKKSTAPLVTMVILALILVLSSAAQGQTATITTANVEEITMVDPVKMSILTSLKNEIENNYTNAIIIETSDTITLKLILKTDTITIKYSVIKRERKGSVVTCQTVPDRNLVEFVHYKKSTIMYYNYVKEVNDYYAEMVFVNLKVQK